MLIIWSNSIYSRVMKAFFVITYIIKSWRKSWSLNFPNRTMSQINFGISQIRSGFGLSKLEFRFIYLEHPKSDLGYSQILGNKCPKPDHVPTVPLTLSIVIWLDVFGIVKFRMCTWYNIGTSELLSIRIWLSLTMQLIVVPIYSHTSQYTAKPHDY